MASEIPNSAQKKIEIDQSKVNPDNINGNQEKNHETAKKNVISPVHVSDSRRTNYVYSF